ncbi:MAG: LacI family DNA-binding transcriptional regulator [Candidatus Hydrogenedentes bacterium]|nr:LacI family DNA-binding transcriptional regulator [Candidatus Hydrogenedentota bacterium]
MPIKDGRWTIHDIAREAGVSAKTVSRVLNRQSGVSETVRGRIQQLMDRVGYQPHIGARSLRGHMNACIGVTMPAMAGEVPLSQEFLLWLFGYLYQTFSSRGEYLGFDLNPHAAGDGGDYGRGVWQRLFKACIVAGPLRLDDTVLRRIHDFGVPYMATGRLDGFPEASTATVDYEEGAYQSTKFLLERGHRRIALIKAFSGFQPGLERRRGYRRALEEAGAGYDPALVIPVNFESHNITAAAHRLLADRTVTALIDSSGTEDGASLREGARRACRVPGLDFDLVAWTYVNNAAVLTEAAAHVWLPVREAAAQGITDLAAWVAGERSEPVRVLYPPVLDTRRFSVEEPKPRRLFELQE